MHPYSLSRRQFLGWAGGLAAAAVWPDAAEDEPREYFVPLEDYHELPEDCYEPNRIRPLEIILHWDGNTRGRKLWVTAMTYQTLRLLQQSSHFAVDYKRVWQLLPMYADRVQESHGARGYNKVAINVEMAGLDFDQPDNAPPKSEVQLALRLVSRLMDFYAIPFEAVLGHYERDDRGLKHDPGPQFMAGFRQELLAYRRGLAPLKAAHLGE